MRSATSDSAVIRVGVTGHRKLGDDPAARWRVHAECVRALTRLEDVARLERAAVEAYSALAVGADQLFAKAALGLGIPLVGVIPFEDYPNDFKGADRDQFETLLARCRHVHRLPAKRRSDRAYLKAGLWIVDHVDFLVAAWDGKPAARVGGTGDVVAYAQGKSRPVFHIDPKR